MNEKYAVLRTHVQRYIYIYIYFWSPGHGEKKGERNISRGNEPRGWKCEYIVRIKIYSQSQKCFLYSLYIKKIQYLIVEIFILTWKIQPIYLFILSFAKLYTIKIFLHNKYRTITIKKRLIPSNNIHSARRWNIRIQQNHHRSPRLNLNPSWTEGRSKGKTFAIDCIYIYHRQIGGGRGGIGLQRPHKFITNINFHDTNLPRIDNGPGYASPLPPSLPRQLSRNK